MMAFIDPHHSQRIEPVSAELVKDTGYLVVNIDKASYTFLDRPVRWDNRIFQPKIELHITIISQDAEKVLRATAENAEMLARVQNLVSHTDWRFHKLSDFYHIVETPGVETLIQMVALPALPAFFEELSSLLGEHFHLPPTHVTLYTLGTEKGIGLPTRAVFEELTRSRVDPAAVLPV